MATRILKEDLENLVRAGLKDVEIAKILKCAIISVFFARKRYNICRESFSEAKEIVPNQFQLELITGMLLGDGSMKLSGRMKNPVISCEHGKAQQEYNYWKYENLLSLNAKFHICKRKTIDKRTGIFYESSIVRLPSNSFYLKLHKYLYINGKKCITEAFLENFSELSLAVMFMDDGSKTNHSLRINTQCFSLKDLEIFNKFTNKKWGITFNIQKHNILYLPVKYYTLFRWLVKDYIHPTMNYKLHVVS